MIQWLVIAFFLFFLTSRFFSEITGVLPKWVDVLNFPFICMLAFLALFRSPHGDVDPDEHRFMVRSIVAFSGIVVLSVLVNVSSILLPAAALFLIGFMEGPLLYVSLNKLVTDTERLSERIRKLFMALLIINVVVVILYSMPAYIATGDPDRVSGTYGLNPYQFSMLLLICGGLLMGDAHVGRRSTFLLLLGQAFIFVTFFFLQFRSGAPFFLLAYAAMLFTLYGARVTRAFVFGVLVLGVAATAASFVLAETLRFSLLGFDQWLDILAEPTRFLGFGKFAAYPITGQMMLDNPGAIVLGVGPGNFLSRAQMTFGNELLRSDKGVSLLVSDLFGIEAGRFTSLREQYLYETGYESVFGTRQLSNPQSSYLAPIAEVGLAGGLIVIALYLYLVKRSFFLMRLAKESVREYIPSAVALVGGTVYLFGLAFLDNYWETSRVTLPVWLLFWGTSMGIRLKAGGAPGGETSGGAAPANTTT